MTLVLLDDEAPPRPVPRVPQGDARREHALRDLIRDAPAILPVHELDPSFGRVFTVASELNIPGVGYVDVLLADERGRLVVVECKLWRNPQARREVVGQILDYARELARFAYEDLQRQISIVTRRQGNVLYELACEAGSTLAEAAFVDRVARDLAAGRFLLLVVGDGITEGARRIGEYLRAQPGLAFEFGLIEMAEYRYADASGAERAIVQPRLRAAQLDGLRRAGDGGGLRGALEKLAAFGDDLSRPEADAAGATGLAAMRRNPDQVIAIGRALRPLIARMSPPQVGAIADTIMSSVRAAADRPNQLAERIVALGDLGDRLSPLLADEAAQLVGKTIRRDPRAASTVPPLATALGTIAGRLSPGRSQASAQRVEAGLESSRDLDIVGGYSIAAANFAVRLPPDHILIGFFGFSPIRSR